MHSIVESNDQFYINPAAAIARNQIPDVYHTSSPLFVDFIREYFNWFFSSKNPGYNIRTFLQNRNIDNIPNLKNIPDTFDLSNIDYNDLVNKFFSIDNFENIPINFNNTVLRDLIINEENIGNKLSDIFLKNVSINNIAASPSLILKHILEIYERKGTKEAFELFFQLFFNTPVTVEQPGNNVFTISDSIWYQPKYLEINISDINPINYVDYLIQYSGQEIVGAASYTTAIIEDFNICNINGKQVIILVITSVNGNFQVGENLYINNTATNIIVNGSLNSILITSGGGNFNTGDTINIESTYGVQAQGEVINTASQNGVIEFNIVNGGNGFGVNTQITITPQSNVGVGASFEIGELTDISTIAINYDHVSAYLNTSLSAASYNFPDNMSANINTVIGQAITFTNYTIGKIASLKNINPGQGYNANVTINVVDTSISSLNISDGKGGILGNNAVITGDVGSAKGALNTIKIISSGYGFIKNELLKITSLDGLNSAYGYAELNGMGFSDGYWLNNKSQLSSIQTLQDDWYYQIFSYVLNTSVPTEKYDRVVQENLHPIGFVRFDKSYYYDFVDSNFNSNSSIAFT